VTDLDRLDGEAAAMLTGRREGSLLEEPSVRSMTQLLIRSCRDPAPWVRAAAGTLGRFAREIAGGDLGALLREGRLDPGVASASLDQLALRHDGLAGSQLASLAFGPKLWWTASGVEVPWRPVSSRPSVTPPMPGRHTDGDTRLLLLAVIGSGATEAELLSVRVRDAGSLNASGELVPDLRAEPLAVSYQPAEGGPRRVSFLSYELRTALLQRMASRGHPGPDEPLLLPAEATARASARAANVGTSLIAAGNEVNVSLCRATGDFFRAWGMPGARFDQRCAAPPAPGAVQGQPPSTPEESR